MFSKHYDVREAPRVVDAYSIIYEDLEGPKSNKGFQWGEGDDADREEERLKSKEAIKKLAMKDPGKSMSGFKLSNINVT